MRWYIGQVEHIGSGDIRRSGVCEASNPEGEDVRGVCGAYSRWGRHLRGDAGVPAGPSNHLWRGWSSPRVRRDPVWCWANWEAMGVRELWSGARHDVHRKAPRRYGSAVVLFFSNCRLAHPEKYLFSLSEKLFPGSKYPKKHVIKIWKIQHWGSRIMFLGLSIMYGDTLIP